MPEAVDIRSVTLRQAAKLLGVPTGTIKAHLARGAPRTKWRIDLVAYGAWLCQEDALRGSGPGTSLKK